MIFFLEFKEAFEVSPDYDSKVKKYFLSWLWTEPLGYMNWLEWIGTRLGMVLQYGFKHVPNSYFGIPQAPNYLMQRFSTSVPKHTGVL